MIVRFHLECGGQAVADIDDARVFARPLQHLRCAGRQPAQMYFARLVGAVLAPHHAEDAQLGEVRVTTENFLDARVLFGRKAVLSRQFWCDSYFSVQHLFAYKALW